MATKNPLVSVIITNYNYAQYVGEAIKSVLNQTYENLEIIVIDDGSTDNSDKIISGYAKKNKNIRYIKQKNQGVVSARNKGLAKISGEFFLFLDGDDMLPNDYVKTLIAVAQEDEVDVVYTDYQKFGETDDKSDFPEYDLEKLKRGNYIHVSALVRSSVVKRHKFDERLSKLSHEDWDFFLGIALDGAKIKKAKQVRLLYRVHSSSRSLQIDDAIKESIAQQSLKSVKSFLYIIDKYKIGIYADSEMVSWGALSFERLQFIKNLQKIVKEKDDQIKEKDEIIACKDRQIADIVNSKRYKIGKIVAAPISVVKSVTKRRK